ncbi:MAG: cytochrome c biogenesis heme-transporting ATPase CcmA [Pseudomonadota bacterium]
MLEVSGLAAVRGERLLFSGLRFSVSPGDLLQVVGRNGSGKTTLLRILARLVRPESGDIRWRGAAIDELGDPYFADLLYLGHAPAIKDELTAEENLRYATAIAGTPAAASTVRAALAEAGLAGRETLPGRALSQGQRRRVALARLALGGRALWVLDEPLAALDSESADRLRGWLGTHLDAGGCAVVATHAPLAGHGLPLARVRTLELGLGR